VNQVGIVYVRTELSWFCICGSLVGAPCLQPAA
jgi:hypothetical protein